MVGLHLQKRPAGAVGAAARVVVEERGRPVR